MNHIDPTGKFIDPATATVAIVGSGFVLGSIQAGASLIRGESFGQAGRAFAGGFVGGAVGAIGVVAGPIGALFAIPVGIGANVAISAAEGDDVAGVGRLINRNNNLQNQLDNINNNRSPNQCGGN
ncbi:MULTISPECIES: hypothetical protein [unclassified Halobacteriovorax]|uniref:hypothetical protein n=1 Tax=unclassified Halobacteriovorax TaxID=2639665 RepID=UPI003999DAB8